MNMASAQQGSQRLSQLLEGFAIVEQDMDREVNALFIDSREASEGGLFMACAGTQGHGVDYMSQACAAGVAAIAWEPTADYPLSPQQAADCADVPLIAVENLHQQLGYIADRFYGHPSHDLHVIGITGTDGKTSCSHFLANALQHDERPTGLIGTLGYGLTGALTAATHTTPDAIRVHQLLHQMREQGAQYVVMEVSSHALDQGRVNGVLFEVAVLTNVSRDHLDYHGDQDTYARAKEQLFYSPGLAHAVINGDDDYGRQWLNSLPQDLHCVVYGVNANAADEQMLEISALQLSDDGIDWQVRSPWGEAQLHSHLYGRFNVYNLAAVLSTLAVLDVSWADACRLVEQLQTVPGRMEFCRSNNNSSSPLVIIDFAHTPDALQQVLLALKEHGFGRICCVFGCGGDRDRGKRALMGRAAETLADQLVLTDDNPRSESGDDIIEDILGGIADRQHVHIERDRKAAIAWAIEQGDENTVVLVAGKGDESYQWVGDSKLEFSDRQVVQSLLQGGLH